jgi:hypothetical protein
MSLRTDAELQLAYADQLDALDAAKQAHRADPSDETRTELARIKGEIREFRQHWREIRAFLAPPTGPGDATVTPDVITAKTTTRKVG